MKSSHVLAIKIAALVGVVIVAVLLQARFDIGSWFERERIDVLLAEAGGLAPLVYIAGMALAVVVSPIPSLPLDIAAGVFFGPYLGTLYSTIGALLGAMASFAIARSLGRDLVERMIHGHINFCTRCSDRLLTKIVFFSRLIPVVSFDVVSYGAGLTAMRLSRFAVATALGMLPLTFVYNAFGSVLVVRGWVSLTVGGLFVVLFFFIPRLIERRNLFGLRRYFSHGDASSRGAGDSASPR